MMSFRIRREISTTISIFTFFLLASLFFQQEAAFAKKIWKITSQNIEEVREKAEAGDAYYQAILGRAYSRGYNAIKINLEEQLKWTRLAAKQKHPIGLFTLASIYRIGAGIEKDEEKAKALYKKALPGIKKLARKGNPIAQYSLSSMYRDGYGVKIDYDKHYEWRDKALKVNYGPAQYAKGIMMIDALRFEDSIEWFQKAAEQGLAHAQSFLGGRYSLGKGVTKDEVMAMKWFRKSAEQGNQFAQHTLGRKYFEGEAVKQDYAEAKKWFKKAAEQGGRIAEWSQEKIALIEAKLKEEAKQVRKAMLEELARIDSKTGLRLHSVIKGNGLADNPEVEKMVTKAIKGYGAGLEDMGKESFMKAVKTDPVFLYTHNYWYNIHQYQLPLSLAGEILLAVKQEKKESPGFWFDYAHTANLAGQPVLALTAVKRLEQINGNMSDEKKKKAIQNITAVLKANAYIQMGRDRDAYAVLFENGELDKEDFALVNYINHWAKPLLKDKKKLSILTGIEESKFTGKYAIPQPQAFHNIETGKLITPAAPPKLEIKPETAEPRTTTQPVQKSIEPDVMILD